MKKFYLASGLGNAANARALCDTLERAGHSCTFKWWEIENNLDESKPWNDAKRTAVAHLELAGVAGADVVIALMPGGIGTHVELGAALATGIPVALIPHPDQRSTIFHYHTGVCRLLSVPNLLRWMEAA